MKHSRTLSLIAGCLLSAAPLPAADWPQYRGPQQDGISPEPLPVKTWPPGGLPQIWKSPTPTGFSSFSVAGGGVFTIVAREVEGAKREVCVALDAATGHERWAAVPMCVAKYSGGGDSGGGGDGPRSTPTYNDGLVYVYDSQLLLQCLNAQDGRVVWSKDIVKEFDGRNISWQSAASPVVDGNLLIVPGGGPGQSLLAFDKKTGAVAWKSYDDKMTHATPVVTTLGGVRQIVFFMQKGLVSVAAATGKTLWSYPFKYTTSTAASPVICGDLVYCSAGYGVGAGLVKIAGSGDSFTATEVWRKESQLVNHWSTPVFHDGYLYGIFGFKEYNTRRFEMCGAQDGQRDVVERRLRPGQCDLGGRSTGGVGRPRAARPRQSRAGSLPRSQPHPGGRREMLVDAGLRRRTPLCAQHDRGSLS